jgi:hypothetical protein
MPGILCYFYKIENKIYKLYLYLYLKLNTRMGTLYSKIIELVLYFTKINEIKKESCKEDKFEDEWGQFCDISKPLYNYNKDRIT